MAAKMQKPIRWLVGLLSSLVFPLIAAALGWDEPWLVVGASALFGALCLWNLNHAYREWINDERAGWKVPTWLKHNLSLAMVGVVFVLGAALLMRWSSAENESASLMKTMPYWLKRRRIKRCRSKRSSIQRLMRSSSTVIPRHGNRKNKRCRTVLLNAMNSSYSISAKDYTKKAARRSTIRY